MTRAALLCGVVVLCAAGAAFPASDPTDWISEIGGKVKRDQAGYVVAVSLRGSWISDAQMIELARMPRLEVLDLSHTRISDEGMLYLKPATQITDLNLFYTEQITDQGIHAIKNWKHLKRLNLRGTRISDGALEVISQLTQLEALDIANTQVTDNGLDSLVTLVNLKELSLGRRRESDHEVELLRLVPTLTNLDLSGPTGAERPDAAYQKAHASGAMRADLVRAIAELPELRVLRIGYSNIDANGLRAWSGLKHVERVGLEACGRVDDEAVAELGNWKSLQYVDLQATKATEAGAEALRKAKPGITILGPATAVKTATTGQTETGR